MTAGVVADMTATGVAAMVVIGVMAAGMTAGVTAEATIALAVVIAMKGGQKTEDLPIAMVSFELTFFVFNVKGKLLGYKSKKFKYESKIFRLRNLHSC